jgi:hypothetical protein
MITRGRNRSVVINSIEDHACRTITNLEGELPGHETHPFTRKKAARNPGRLTMTELLKIKASCFGKDGTRHGCAARRQSELIAL